ncbi:hypothetical protein DICPUDRAFT_13661, partial [Dictyostelium purpureum]
MSDSLIDLDFETTAENPSSNVLPLGTDALLSYSSPKSEKKQQDNKNQSKENTTNENNDLFDDLGIQNHSDKVQTDSNAKPLTESEILSKFSSPKQSK